ncbi:MAG: acyloxyacyl hydrolase [Burkholderiaceae bacterium]|jgi:hypothetical protein|nr:acyloxyacyl hydrolase [Burkholderiaceae bacterium]
MALLTAIALPTPAAAQFPIPDDLTLAIASGSRHSVSKVELDAGWTQQHPLWQGQNWRLRLRHEIALGQWRVPDARNITELGYSPVFRLEKPGASGTFFVEGSIGVRLLSHTRLAPRSTLTTTYQFADMAGIGMQWGQGTGAQTVGLRFQHQSNADIKKPNPGINFIMLYYSYAF